MRFSSEQRLDDGVLEREFILGEIPGVLWTPGSAPVPLILSGHNGGLHKRHPRLVARARHYAAEYGFAVAAIDAPGHGDRPRHGPPAKRAATRATHVPAHVTIDSRRPSAVRACDSAKCAGSGAPVFRGPERRSSPGRGLSDSG